MHEHTGCTYVCVHTIPGGGPEQPKGEVMYTYLSFLLTFIGIKVLEKFYFSGVFVLRAFQSSHPQVPK